MAGSKKTEVKIGFPVECTYRGGHSDLGKHGKHFWIKEGRLGHGQLHLTHSVPLSKVASVEVAERQFPGSGARTMLTFGNPMGYRGGPRASAPKQLTDIVVRTKDGQGAHWVVGERSAEWVRNKLRSALHDAGIPFHDDLPPSAVRVWLLEPGSV